MRNNHKQAISVFEKVESTLIRNRTSDFTIQSRKRAMGGFKKMLRYFRTASDNDLFFDMTMVVFYSGFRATTVSNKESIIYGYFKSYERTATYTSRDVNRILNDRKMIANRNKIESVIYNAKQFVKVMEQLGSFKAYLLSFNDKFPISEDGLDELRGDLITRFAYMGPATVNQFLKDLGFPVVKPDRMVMRVMHRTHLVAGESVRQYRTAIDVCRVISKQLEIPMAYVDKVFVCLGQVGEANICAKNKPKCDMCDLKNVCKFYV